MASEADLAIEAEARRHQAMMLREVLETWTDEDLRGYCRDQARRFTDALYRYGVVNAEGTIPGRLPNFNPRPEIFREVLHGEITGQHVGGLVSYFHKAETGDVREMLAALADWHDNVATALLAGEPLPTCVVCGADHTPRDSSE